MIAACKLVTPKIAARTAAPNIFFIFDPFVLISNSCLDEQIIKILNEARMNKRNFLITNKTIQSEIINKSEGK